MDPGRPAAAGFCLLAVALLQAQDPPASGIRFIERAASSGVTVRTVNGDPGRPYIIDTLGSGVALLDYDRDEDLDIYIANGSRLEPQAPGTEPLASLYRNDGTGRFQDVTAGSGLAVPFWGFGVATGDYDNDGDPDLYVTSWGPNRLFRNEGDGTFSEVGRAAGVDHDGFGTGAAFFDYDNDGALDLYVANYVTFDPLRIPKKGDPNSPCNFRGLTVMCGPQGLPGAADVLFHNNGDGTFSDATAATGLVSPDTYYGLGVLAADLQGDTLPDILVANDSTPNFLYRNMGGGRFTEQGVLDGLAYSSDGREQAGMGIDAADIEGDGDLDVFITNFSHDYSTLRLNDGAGQLEDVTVRIGLAEATIRTLGWGTLLFDMENDGDIDIFIANGHVYPEVDRADIGTSYLQRNQFLENLGDLRFREPPADGTDGGPGLHRGAAAGDLDGDGDLDLAVTVMEGPFKLLVNESTAGSWLQIRLVGRASNRDGVGARATVEADGRVWTVERMGGRSYLSASDPRLHFGLGRARQVDAVRIRWPSGTVQTIQRPPINRILTVEEPSSKPISAKGHPS